MTTSSLNLISLISNKYYEEVCILFKTKGLSAAATYACLFQNNIQSRNYFKALPPLKQQFCIYVQECEVSAINGGSKRRLAQDVRDFSNKRRRLAEDVRNFYNKINPSSSVNKA
ncbi:hypothetical protein COB21_04390 [Candidatus Aerophobetes bacterium]|uniref:Uncharacterized protein n=1 Tax=Aerophobetes bacterium TaxID=2030807 RepID=A0A2A4X1T1_UNCAE|nr:MAG: hypothetical protein COB21_04390 [Candidatus Aerophobetes bacterium]